MLRPGAPTGPGLDQARPSDQAKPVGLWPGLAGLACFVSCSRLKIFNPGRPKPVGLGGPGRAKPGPVGAPENMRGAKSRTPFVSLFMQAGPDFERRARRLGLRRTLNPPGIPTTFLKNARRKRQHPIRFPFYASRAGFRETFSTAWS